LKYLCIHGHFSLPPRQDPFTGEIPGEADATPFRNLYEQVTADCYRPNAVLGNFDLMSFDVAPSLLAWLEARDAATYSRILAADRGNAMATTFNHVILPLFSRRDKVTQVVWGLKAFESHFGRKAAGLWLPEMAVDQETLAVLAECGVEFTLLSSEQVGGGDSLAGAGPYRVRVEGGRELAIFARDRELSNKISFELNWLGGAGMFAARHLVPRMIEGLLLIATGGETYGHYHTDEEMFLRYLLQQETSRAGYQVVPLAGFLRDHPPQIEIQIASPTSWSCSHGVERWKRDCGCASSAAWKAPLREALLALANAADAIYEREACKAGLAPWAVRDGYAEVLVKHVPGSSFLANYESHAPTRAAQDRVLTLLHAQVHRLAMFNSHAFFGTEFETTEVRNVVAHAARVVNFIAQATGDDLAGDLRRNLALAIDPRSERTATEIYTEIVEAHQA
jgi:alpha-amylase/alpha-mannosidase (GH57 family)